MVMDLARIALVFFGGCLLAAGLGLLVAGLVMGAMSPMVSREAPPSCPACGYDLRGLRSRRCPECGWNVPARWWDFGDSLARLGLDKADRLLTLGAVCLGAGMLLLALV